jgi:ATP-dependent DNA helicase RecQ
MLKGNEQPLLLEPARKKAAPKPPPRLDSWEGVDQGLFEELRQLRRELAQERGLPAYIVFGDASLRDMARLRPSTPSAFLRVFGVGEKKLEQYGKLMLDTIRQYCQNHALEMDAFSRPSPPSNRRR